MQYLSFSDFVFPVIAISLTLFFYFFLLHRATQSKIFKQYVLTVILLALLFNLAWEILQITLYEGGTYSGSHIFFCALASVADAVMVLLIYFGFAILYKNALWVQNLSLSRIIFLILTGGLGAVVAEIWYLSIGSWSYADAMPVIPIVNAGLSPVLQFIILPILIYILSFKIVFKSI